MLTSLQLVSVPPSLLEASRKGIDFPTKHAKWYSICEGIAHHRTSGISAETGASRGPLRLREGRMAGEKGLNAAGHHFKVENRLLDQSGKVMGTTSCKTHWTEDVPAHAPIFPFDPLHGSFLTRPFDLQLRSFDEEKPLVC